MNKYVLIQLLAAGISIVAMHQCTAQEHPSELEIYLKAISDDPFTRNTLEIERKFFENVSNDDLHQIVRDGNDYLAVTATGHWHLHIAIQRPNGRTKKCRSNSVVNTH